MEMIIFSGSIGQSKSTTVKISKFEDSIDSPVSSHFYSYSRSDLSLLSIESLSSLLSEDELVIETEDWLLELILELGPSYYSLLDYVRYEFLSSNGISQFCDHIDCSEITGKIWSQLSLRLKGIIDDTLRKRRFHVRGVSLDSRIVNELPSILSRFENKRTQ
jgi:hypothetical protein